MVLTSRMLLPEESRTVGGAAGGFALDLELLALLTLLDTALDAMLLRLDPRGLSFRG